MRTIAEPARLPADGCPLGVGQRAALATEIAAAYLRARRGLRREPIERVVAGLRSGGPGATRPAAEALPEAARLGRAVCRTMLFLPGDTRCLRRSLVLTRLLARRGIRGRLVIGARTEPEFLAHAWVEIDGIPILATDDVAFGRLVEL
jgi:Transglutaminase-like superfamily